MLNRFLWMTGLGLFIFGIATLDTNSLKWGALGVLIFSLPLLSLFQKSSIVRAFTFWGAVLVMIQAVISYHFPNYRITDAPNQSRPLIFRGEKGTYTTDALGNREFPVVDYSKPKQGLRYLAVGASTTLNYYMPDHLTWPFLVQEKLKKKTGQNVEVLSVAVSGIRAIHNLAVLEAMGNVPVDGIIFLLGVNDWVKQISKQYNANMPGEQHGFFEREDDKYLLKYSLLGRLLAKVMKSGPKEEGEILQPPPDGFLFGAVDSLNREDKRSFKPSSPSPDYLKVLERMARLCKKRQVQCLFLSQPNAYSEKAEPALKKHFWMTPPRANFTLDLESMTHIANLYNKTLEQFAQSHGLGFCDVAPKIAPTLENYIDEVHFSPAGCEKVASAVVSCLGK